MLLINNSPSRTAMDGNGDLFVANQAFGVQSSVTRIAASTSDCVDRNGNGKIDTSSDTSGDGFIQVDCNGDGSADTIDGVKQKPCNNGLAQEFYGSDDECLLWTTNTFGNNQIGRSVASVPRKGGGGTDVWAGGYNNKTFVLLDGTKGNIKDSVQLPNSNPFAAIADGQGIVWSGPLGGGNLCWFESNTPSNNGVVRGASFGSVAGFGITVDRDQNVWMGSTVVRYTPDRSAGVKNLSNGWWTKFVGVNGTGITADSRNANEYFVWSCGGGTVVRLPASAHPSMKVDQTIPNPGWLSITMPCFGVGVDTDQNVWGAQMQQVTRALVDKNGKITQPVVNGPPMGMNLCPAGDSCKSLAGEVMSDFTGFHAARPNSAPTTGRYSRIVVSNAGCGGRRTMWLRLSWDADVPAGTRLEARYRSGDSPMPDITWSAWNPALANPETLNAEHPYLQVEFLFNVSMPGVTPTLKSFTLLSECVD